MTHNENSNEALPKREAGAQDIPKPPVSDDTRQEIRTDLPPRTENTDAPAPAPQIPPVHTAPSEARTEGESSGATVVQNSVPTAAGENPQRTEGARPPRDSRRHHRDRRHHRSRNRNDRYNRDGNRQQGSDSQRAQGGDNSRGPVNEAGKTPAVEMTPASTSAPASSPSPANVPPAREVETLFLMTQEGGEISVAVVEDGVLEELYIERDSASKIYGNIFKAVVKSIVPAIDAAFVDIGTGKDGFLYLNDLEEQEAESEDVFFDFGADKKQPRPEPKPKRPLQVREGDVVTVQVVKEAIRNKGPRLTTKLSVPARYLVLTPGEAHVGVSRRIADRTERDRIKGILAGLCQGKEGGFIARTAADGKSEREFARDVKYLTKVWQDIQKRSKKGKAPFLVHSELSLVERIIRDNFIEENAKIITDSKEIFNQVQHFIRAYIPESKTRAIFYKEQVPLFAKYNIDKDIENTFAIDVPLKSGGSIVIEQTEGMTAIDVNSGRFTDQKNLEETAFRTNMEAAREVVRQLRLRDIGGIIVIDFIDMQEERHNRQLMRTLNESVKRDRAKVNILRMSEIGVVEMTRQRIRASKESSVFDHCPYCAGRGSVKSLATMRIHVLKELRHKGMNLKRKTLEISLNPEVAEAVLDAHHRQIREIERMNGNKILIIADPSFHREDMDIKY